MDIYKVKFTKLQQEILRFFFIKSGISFNERGVARHLKVSPTAVSNSLVRLEKEELLKVEKDRESKRLSISLNKGNPKGFALKRIENLKLIYESGLADFLSEQFPEATIILFGSYAFGEDAASSDIDIAIIGSKEKTIDALKYAKMLERDINFNFYRNFKSIQKNLLSNIVNGITLAGGVQL